MNSVGQSGDRKSYRVILLLIVGLTAFSSAMKELNLLRESARDTSNLVASWARWSGALTPDGPEVPKAPDVVPVPVPPVEEVEVCENSHTLPELEQVDHLQLGGNVARAEVKNKDVGKIVVAERSKHRNEQAVATLRGRRSADIELMELRNQVRRGANFKVMIMADHDREAQIALPSDFEFKVPKVKTYRAIRPDERELLKTLNRGLNLRSAG